MLPYEAELMSSGMSKRRNITFIGELAAVLASVSARYLRTIAQQVERVVKGSYRIYLRFETVLVSAVTDVLLFIWALRSFALIVLVQLVLIAGALRWPVVWIPAIAFGMLLITAAREMLSRDWREDEQIETEDPLRDAVFSVVRWLQRACLLIVGLSVTVLFTVNKVEALWTGMGPSAPGSELSDATVATVLEPSWNYYAREEIFLGRTYFGNTTSFGRYRDSQFALALDSDHPVYRALAARHLIELEPFSINDMPTVIRTSGATVNHAAAVAVTSAGKRLGVIDTAANTVTFVFGAYRIETITRNIPIKTREGGYRLVEGNYVFDLVEEFGSLWTDVGRPTYRERRFRVILRYDTTEAKWKVAHASNGSFTAEDTGPRNGAFESSNVPPTLDNLR